MVLDFTSALYLGLKHPAASIPPWRALSLGVPAALESSPTAFKVEAAFARLAGTDAAIVYPSSLHLFLDICALEAGSAFFVDSGAYPVATWGIQNAVARNAFVVPFRHFDPKDLSRALARYPDVSPIVVSDGYCPSCGRSAPLGEFQRLARLRDGLVIVDDTQAMGILGHDASFINPLGAGGAGSAAHQGLSTDRLVVAASLAKGLGVPVAVAGGPRWFIDRIRAESVVRVHCSPPSEPVLSAGLRALVVNAAVGDFLRRRLLANIQRLKARLAESAVTAHGGPFPVQMIQPCGSPAAVHQDLLGSDVRTVLVRRRCVGDVAIAAIVTAAHTSDELERAADIITRAVARHHATRLHTFGDEHVDHRRSLRCAPNVTAYG